LKKKYVKTFRPEEVERFWRKEMKPQWVIEEEVRYKDALEWERSKPKEEQEWYQKWLRRQENKIINWGADWKDDGGPIDPEEKRQSSEDKEYYTYEEVKKKYAKTFKPEEVERFWRKEMRPQWVVEEEVKYKEALEWERAKPKEEQEWYQKWLRRQENKIVNWAADWKDDGGPIDPQEMRIDSADKEYYTFEQVKKKYASEFKPEEVESYWRKAMKPQWVVEEEAKYKEAMEWERQKPKEEQEWYQKWLRRQENRPMAPTSEWKDDKGPIDPNEERQNQEDKEWYTFEKIKEKYGKEYKPEELESYWRRECKPYWVVEQEDAHKNWEEQEKAKPKEEQEWYQKWLRRQENRPGAWANWKEPEDAPIDENEQRQDPNDKEWRTYAEVKKKYVTEYKPEEIETYWRKEMKPEWRIKEEEDKMKHEEAERAKPKEEQEWYQKWLRRQESRPGFADRWKPKEEADTPDTYKGKKINPDDNKEYTFEELSAQYSKEFSEEDLKMYWKKDMKWVEE